MKFIVRFEHGEEGPIDQETLEKWVDTDKITSDTPVRNALIKDWKEAGELDFLKPLFEQQKERLDVQKGVIGHLKDSLHKKKKSGKEEKSTAFIHKYLPDPAPLTLRICAFLFDMIPIGLCFLILFAIGAYRVYKKASEVCPPVIAQEERISNAENAEGRTKPAVTEAVADEAMTKTAEKLIERKDNLKAERPPTATDDVTQKYLPGSKWIDITTQKVYHCLSGEQNQALWIDEDYVNSTFYILFTIFFIFVLLYYGITIGLFAQTFGMWFWGIFVTKTDVSEVYLFRAYLFSLLLIFLGFLTPFFLYLNPLKRSLHELLTGTMVIRISAKPKA